MFRMQDAAMALIPQAQLGPQFCFHYTCGCTYTCGATGWCHWYFQTHFPCVALTTHTILEVACQNATQPVIPQCGVTRGDPAQHVGDPVEQLVALRQQLEVALAGVVAQEKVLREQQAAHNQAGGAPAAAQPERK